MALAPPLALKLAAGLAVAVAVGAADRGGPPQGRSAVTVSRAPGNRWIVTDSAIWRLPLGVRVERTCARGYSFRQRHWRDLGCRVRAPAHPAFRGD